MTPESQQSTAAPSYATTPTGTVTSEEVGDQTIHAPTGTSGIQPIPSTEATPTGTAPGDGSGGGAHRGMPCPNQDAGGNRGGPVTFDMSADNESA